MTNYREITNFGMGLLSCIFLTFACGIAALRSYASIGIAHNRESRILAINGFIFDIIGSVIFGLGTVYFFNRFYEIYELLLER